MSRSPRQKASTTVALCTALKTTTPSTGVSVDGYDGVITLEIVAVGTVAAQAVTFTIEGSLDNSNFYTIGSAQFDATASPTYAAAAITLTPGNGTIRHLYLLRAADRVEYVRINPSANSLGTGLTVTLYTVPA